MASGLHIFLSNIKQHKEIINVDSRCGLTYKAGDEKNFEEKLEQFLKLDSYEVGKIAEKVFLRIFAPENERKLSIIIHSNY